MVMLFSGPARKSWCRHEMEGEQPDGCCKKGLLHAPVVRTDRFVQIFAGHPSPDALHKIS